MANVDGTSFICDDCGGQFKSTKRGLANHMRNIHGDWHIFNCDLCSKGFNRKDQLARHLLAVHQHVNYKCNLCAAQYTNKKYLENHHSAIHQGIGFECDECGKLYGVKGHLDRHIKTVHLPSLSQPMADIELAVLICDDCGRQFETKLGLTAHMKNNHGRFLTFTCDLCSKEISEKGNLALHIREIHQHINAYKCNLRAAEYNDRRALQHHDSNTHRGIEFECDECGKLFGWKTGVTIHITSVHQKLRRFECYICGAKYLKPSHLKNHTSVKHNGEKFQCDDCDATTGQKIHLITHILSAHMKLMHHRLKCDQCPAEFNSRTHLTWHEQIIHKHRVLICDICSKRYPTKQRMGIHCFAGHMGLHVFKCDQCPAALSGPSTLIRHKQSVHEHRRFVCDICPQTFTRKGQLTDHCFDIHMGLRVFKCSVCCEMFTNLRILSRHKENRH